MNFVNGSLSFATQSLMTEKDIVLISKRDMSFLFCYLYTLAIVVERDHEFDEGREREPPISLSSTLA
jgi:hypothetical protein